MQLRVSVMRSCPFPLGRPGGIYLYSLKAFSKLSRRWLYFEADGYSCISGLTGFLVLNVVLL